VRIFGTDSSGKVFSDKAVTVNVSRNGAELSGVHPTLNLDEIIGLSYGANRVHFRVKWVGEPGTAKEGHVGLLNTSPEKPLWTFHYRFLHPTLTRCKLRTTESTLVSSARIRWSFIPKKGLPSGHRLPISASADVSSK